MIESKEKTIARILQYCEAHRSCGDWSTYEKSKKMLNKISMTSDEYQTTITKIVTILFI
jgi:hypothetical protein